MGLLYHLDILVVITQNMSINALLFGGKVWVETVGADDAFDGYISAWIADARVGNLTKKDVLKAVTKIANHRNDLSILSKAKSRLGLSEV